MPKSKEIQTKQSLIIAIDGPAGSGKSTVGRMIADKYGLLYIDTGAMYRAMTLKAIERNIALSDEAALIQMAKSTDIWFVNKPGEANLKVMMDARDVTGLIRSPKLTSKIKHIAQVPEIRKVLVNLQRRLASQKQVVLEGRDIGTVVFPDATFKFYLTADIKERARRRFAELEIKNENIVLDDIISDIKKRDTSDITRKISPLKKADDAIEVNTTNMTISDVVEHISQIAGLKK